MEQEMDAGKFWLPTEFLNDEEILNAGIFTVSEGAPTCFGRNSDLTSPVESVMGSTGTESDEEDYLNELSRKLAQYSLEDEFCNTETYKQSTRFMAGSPQSTLCGCKQASSRGSPDGFSPPAPVSRNESAWDLLYAAAGEVARLRLEEELRSKYYNPNRNHVVSQPTQKIPSPNFQFHQIQAAQLKQQQLMKQQQKYQQFIQQSQHRNSGGITKPMAVPSWPTLQQSQKSRPPPGSGMRAVFLGNPNAKRESTGTGVFLPRQIGASTETRKKHGCSTVLLPDRVVEALNLNLEAQARTRSNGGRFPRNFDAETRYRNSVLMAEQRRQQVEIDLRLPQEWTY